MELGFIVPTSLAGRILANPLGIVRVWKEKRMIATYDREGRAWWIMLDNDWTADTEYKRIIRPKSENVFNEAEAMYRQYLDWRATKNFAIAA